MLIILSQQSFIFIQRRSVDGGNDIRTTALNDEEVRYVLATFKESIV
jgi:hypothetical protein